MLRFSDSCRLGIALALLGARATHAQHAGHEAPAAEGDRPPTPAAHMMLQAIPLLTHASPSAGGVPITQFAFTQVVLMTSAEFWQRHGAVDAAFDAEGLTMGDGELATGAYGEGFVDRRHPHAYLHQLMLSGQGARGLASWSASIGRGFAPFGTDDPMVRPIAKFPINHLLAQILERGVGIAALRLGRIIVEGATFGGDEPATPSSLPRISRFGDSWSARATVLPHASTELQASYARVASPEELAGGGLDQRKRSISARAESPGGGRYLLAEWARTVERDHRRDRAAFAYESALAEAAVHVGELGVSLRIEQSERPEEDRLLDAFRTPRPSRDLSINGITRWRAATLALVAPAVTQGAIAGYPFVELATLSAHARDSRSLFTPERLYGTSHFWMLTGGVRIRAGHPHARMGRYGVANSIGH